MSIRFCKDCMHHSCDYDDRHAKIRHKCKNQNLLDLVTGLHTDPLANRMNERLCGRDGKYWDDRNKRSLSERVHNET